MKLDAKPETQMLYVEFLCAIWILKNRHKKDEDYLRRLKGTA